MAYTRPHWKTLFKPKRTLLVGGDGIAVEEFLSRPGEHWIKG